MSESAAAAPAPAGKKEKKKPPANLKIPPKKPKLTKAQRRALQEQQRAAKAAGSAGGGGGKKGGGQQQQQQQQQQQGQPSQSGAVGYPYDSQRGLQTMRGPPPTTARGRQKRRSNGGAVDDGLSMMTSALLTMLDTPEEVEWEQYQDFDEYSPSESSTPVIANRFPAHGAPQHAQIQNNNGNYNINAPLYVPQARKPYYDHEQDESVGMPGYQYEGGGDEGYGIPRGRSMEQMQQWTPSMQGSDQQSNTQGIQIGQSQRAPSAAFEPRNNGSYFP